MQRFKRQTDDMIASFSSITIVADVRSFFSSWFS